jgi:hypothetical protein
MKISTLWNHSNFLFRFQRPLLKDHAVSGSRPHRFQTFLLRRIETWNSGKKQRLLVEYLSIVRLLHETARVPEILDQ